MPLEISLSFFVFPKAAFGGNAWIVFRRFDLAAFGNLIRINGRPVQVANSSVQPAKARFGGFVLQ